MSKRHLAIFSQTAVEAILKGSKTIESRFSQKRIAPFGVVEVGDTVFIKPSGREIIGQFKVKKVITFEGIDETDWKFIRDNFGERISFGSKTEDDKFFKSHINSKYGTLIFIGNIESFITAPIKIQKSDQRGWMVID